MKRIAVLAGGFSGEFEVSLNSAATVMEYLNKGSFEPILVIILKDRWFAKWNGKEYDINKSDFSFDADGYIIKLDFAYVVIHGTPGEDGRLQGYFDMLDIPYSTGGVWNLAATFNKITTKQALDEMGYLTANYIHFVKGQGYDKQMIVDILGLPIFVKSSESGSSIGVTKVKTIDQLDGAIEEAFRYHNQVLIEECIVGREITCGVWRDGEKVKVLPITEVITQKDFFDYKAKYEWDQTVEITPADLDAETYKECQELTVNIYKDMDCDGIVRVDYILSDKGLLIIEINTVPGLTETSFIPQQVKEENIDLTYFFESSIKNKGL